MKLKRFIEKYEDTLSCYFNTEIQFKEYRHKPGEFLPGSDCKEVWFNNKPTSILRSIEDFESQLNDQTRYRTDILSLLTTLKAYK